MSFNIDSTSYTNKDFREIFAELLQLVPELTNKWDPNASNEADPGVVLLKLSAFIADKLNYNIDKNTLENFPKSVTQRGNAQKLYDLLGYDLQYYKSATVPVRLKYSRNGNENGLGGPDNPSKYIVPRFTELTDDNSSVVYTLLDDVNVLLDGTYSTANAIEGSIHTFTVNEQSVITTANLDSDNRIYLEESMVPSNGVFIYNENNVNDLWMSVTNLQATALGRKVYKFGVLPQTNTVYIEFPQDASQVFESGVCIKYVTTQGHSGNVAAYTLTQLNGECRTTDVKVQTPTEIEGVYTYSDDADVALYTIVSNTLPSVNGCDPESLESAYRNFKRVVNTFNTCVTRQDYENTIVQSGVVSNAIVSDRTNDLNYSYKVKTGIIEGDNTVTINQTASSIESEGFSDPSVNPLMTAFDISVYALNLVPNIVDASTYNSSYTTSANVEKKAQSVVEQVKSLQHDWKSTTSEDALWDNKLKPFIFKNMYAIAGKVLTYQKVTETEAAEIESNIQKALFASYNPTVLDFGQEITFDSLLNTIRSSDKRVKDVLLDSPKVVTYVMDSSNNCYELECEKQTDNKQKLKELMIDIVAKSILAGVTPYCVRNMKSTPQYYMKNLDNTGGSKYVDANGIVKNNVIDDITYITTAVTITPSTNNDGTKIEHNEVIQLYAPNYITKTSISTYMYAGLRSSRVVEKDEICLLSDNQFLVIGERRSDMRDVLKASTYSQALEKAKQAEKAVYVYGKGTYFKPSFELNYVTSSDTSDDVDEKIKWLETTYSVDILDKNSVVINKEKTIYAAWIVDDLDNNLFPNNTSEHILGNNEVFMYTDAEKETLVVLQSGTKISKAASNNTVYECPKPNLSTIQSVDSIDTIQWKELSTSLPIETTEMQIVTLGENCRIIGTGNPFTNEPRMITSTESFKYIDESGSICSLSVLPDSWYGYSRLQLLTGPDTVFTLGNNQTITLYNSEEKTVQLKTGVSLTANILTILSGGEKQSAIASGTDNKLAITIFEFDSDSNVFYTPDIPPENIERTSLYTKYNFTVSTNKMELQFNKSFADTVIPVSIVSSNPKIFVQGVTTNDNWEFYNAPFNAGSQEGTPACRLRIDGTIYYLHLKADYNGSIVQLQIVNGDITDTMAVCVYPPLTISGYTDLVLDNRFKITTDNGVYNNSGVLERIDTLSVFDSTVKDSTGDEKIDITSVFDYTYLPKDPIDDPLTPQSFFNPLHIYNKYVISQVDTSKLSVKVADQSKV